MRLISFKLEVELFLILKAFGEQFRAEKLGDSIILLNFHYEKHQNSTFYKIDPEGSWMLSWAKEKSLPFAKLLKTFLRSKILTRKLPFYEFRSTTSFGEIDPNTPPLTFSVLWHELKFGFKKRAAFWWEIRVLLVHQWPDRVLVLLLLNRERPGRRPLRTRASWNVWQIRWKAASFYS